MACVLCQGAAWRQKVEHEALKLFKAQGEPHDSNEELAANAKTRKGYYDYSRAKQTSAF